MPLISLTHLAMESIAKRYTTVSQRVTRFSSCERGGALGHLAWIFPWSTPAFKFSLIPFFALRIEVSLLG